MKEVVKFPEELYKFGKQLQQELNFLKKDSLKPAVMADILRLLERVFVLQQMEVIAYTLAVKNYEFMMNKIVILEKKVEELETKCAGYSERINILETRYNKGEGNE